MFTQGRPVPVTYSCADEAGGSGLASCVGTTAQRRMLHTEHAGHVHLHGDRDRQRRQRDGASSAPTRCSTATNVNGGVSGTVPATLSLTLGAPAQFGALTPGVTRTYLASTTRQRDLDRG